MKIAFPHGGARRISLTATAVRDPTRVANTSLTLQPLGCPEPSRRPVRTAFLGDPRETHRPPRHRSVRHSPASPRPPPWQRSGCGSASTTIRASAGSTTARRACRGRRRTNATIMRLLVQWNLAAKTRPSNPTNPFDPAYSSTTSTRPSGPRSRTTRRSSSRSRVRRAGRTAARTPNVMPTGSRDFDELRARDRVALLGPLRGLSRSCGSTRSGTSRTCSSSYPAVQREGQVGRACELREARRRGVQRASRPGTRRRRSRSVRRPRAGRTSRNGVSDHALARQVRGARREGEPAAQVRRVVAPPVSVQPELAAVPGREVAERLARLASRASTRA